MGTLICDGVSENDISLYYALYRPMMQLKTFTALTLIVFRESYSNLTRRHILLSHNILASSATGLTQASSSGHYFMFRVSAEQSAKQK